MKVATLMAILFSTSMVAPLQAAEPLDVSAVKDVNIVGDAGSTILTTNSSEPFQATLTQDRSAWVSRVSWLWSGDDCASESTLSIEGTTLTVTVASGKGGSCHVTLKANLPEGGNVSFSQPAAEVDMHGSYGQIHLKSAASDFKFAGSARRISAECDALRAGISFAKVANDETVDLQSKLVEADMRFADATAISYRIDAGASMLDSRFESTPGAKPAIFIKADKAKVSIQ